MFARLTSGTVRSPEKQIRLVVNTLYPQAYLDEIVQAEGEWKGKTQRDRIEAVSHAAALVFVPSVKSAQASSLSLTRPLAH